MTDSKALVVQHAGVHSGSNVSPAALAELLELVPPRPGLIVGLGRQLASHWIARLALAGAVHVLDGGNTFDAYGVARFIRSHAMHELEAVMSRITIQRAFTCYQMAALLADLAGPETFRVSQTRMVAEQVRAEQVRAEQVRGVVVLDLLATFADENVPARERRRLFEQSLTNLKSLARQCPTLVTSAAPLAGYRQPPGCARLVEAADQVWHFESQQVPAEQAPPKRAPFRRTPGGTSSADRPLLHASAEQGRLF